MHRVCHVFAGLLVAAALIGPCRAAVVEENERGFAIAQTLRIAAPPDKVYDALAHPAAWWSSSHTFSGSAANLSLEARAGGCFCEANVHGGSVQHAVVVAAMPGAMLRLRGPLGPFQGEGVDSALTYTLKPADGGTDLTLQSNTGGFMKGGFGAWPSAADAMLAEQMDRLKRYLQTGSPEPKSAKATP